MCQNEDSKILVDHLHCEHRVRLSDGSACCVLVLDLNESVINEPCSEKDRIV